MSETVQTESAAEFGKKSRITVELVGVLVILAMAFAVNQFQVNDHAARIKQMESNHLEVNRKLDTLLAFQASVSTLASRFDTVNGKLDNIQQEQRIAFEVAKYKTQDLWTGTMEVEEAEELFELLRSIKADLKKTEFPDVRKIQRSNQQAF